MRRVNVLDDVPDAALAQERNVINLLNHYRPVINLVVAGNLIARSHVSHWVGSDSSRRLLQLIFSHLEAVLL